MFTVLFQIQLFSLKNERKLFRALYDGYEAVLRKTDELQGLSEVSNFFVPWYDDFLGAN